MRKRTVISVMNDPDMIKNLKMAADGPTIEFHRLADDEFGDPRFELIAEPEMFDEVIEEIGYDPASLEITEVE